MMTEKSKVFTKPYLLIVEGVDDEKVMGHLLKDMGLTNVEIYNIGGIARLKALLGAIRGVQGFSNISRLAILVDSDGDPVTRQQSIRTSLSEKGYAVPGVADVVKNGTPSVIYSTIPAADQSGCLEDLLSKCFSEHKNAQSVTSFLTEVGVEKNSQNSRWAKSWIHSMLSTFEEPGKKIGEATQSAYIDIAHPSLINLRNFLKQIVSEAP